MHSKKKIERQKAIIIKRELVNQRSSDEYSKIVYILPLPRGKIRKITLRDSPSHIGNLSNSVDFWVSKGTEVYAAADGIVVETKDDSNVGGNSPKYWDDGNYVTIRHRGEFTHYEHLKFKGVTVGVGEGVKKGQTIGYSGNTGFAHKPHVHFECRKYYGSGENDYVTLRARFKNFKDVYREIDEGKKIKHS